MPAPKTAQAKNRLSQPVAAASAARPPATTRFESTSTPRPPLRSIARPTHGPAKAEINKAAENAANTAERGTPMPTAIGSARMAGK